VLLETILGKSFSFNIYIETLILNH
jgi:hypothetical protein